MISKKCSIEEFVEAVKDKDPPEVIALAEKEATKADRLIMKKRNQSNIENFQAYSCQLKQLINYHRYVLKPRRKIKTTYKLYMKYWGGLRSSLGGTSFLNQTTKKRELQKKA